MGYCTIAHMPLSTGLYTMILPPIAYAIFGSSRHLSVSADSASAAILAAGLVGVAQTGTSNYVALAGLVAGLTGLMLIAARIFHLGFLANFLSRTLLAGFMVGIAVTITCQQVPKMLGITLHTSTIIGTVSGVISHWNEISVPTAITSAICILVLALGTRIKSLPTELVVIVGGIAMASFIGLSTWGIKSVGSVHGGLPIFAMPHVPGGSWPHLLELSLSLVVVILAQSSSLARSYAARYDEPFDADHDLLGLGAANLAAMASGAFVVNSSVTKTALSDRMGSRTQWASLVAAVAVLIAAFTITGALSVLPVAVLATVVMWIALGMIHIGELRTLYQHRRDEWIIAMITAVGVMALGIEAGILLSVALCLLNHVRHGYNPKNHLVTVDEQGRWIMHPVSERSEIAPGLYLYRFQAALYYANVEKFLDDVRSLCSPVPPRCICIDFSGITDVDFTSGQVLQTLVAYVGDRDIHMAFVHVSDEVAEQLHSSDLDASEMLEFNTRLHDLIDHYATPAVTNADNTVITDGPADTSVEHIEESASPDGPRKILGGSSRQRSPATSDD